MVAGRADHRPATRPQGEERLAECPPDAGRRDTRAAPPAARAGAVLAHLYVRAGRADDAQGLPCAIRSDRVAGQDAIPDTSAHAAAWLRLCPSQRRPRHQGAAGLARAQKHSAHGALHRAGTGQVQKLLARLGSRSPCGARRIIWQITSWNCSPVRRWEPSPGAAALSCDFRTFQVYPKDLGPRCQHAGAAHGLLPNLCVCSAASSSALFAFWRQLTSKLRYNHASIAKVSLLLTSTTSAVVATRADTCRTSNSIMSSLSAIFSVPVTSTSLFMVLLLLHYGMLVVTSNTSRLYVWS